MDQADNDGTTPLFAASQNGHAEAIAAAFGASAAMDQARNTGVASLFIASQHGHLEAVRQLLAKRADVALGMTGNGWSPLFVASWSGHAAVVAELLAHSSDPAAATAEDHLEVPAGSTALSVAQLKGHSEVAALLLRA